MNTVAQLFSSRAVRLSQYVVARPLQTAFHPRPLPSTMAAWQFSNYGQLSELSLSPDVGLPVIRHPDHVLVEVHAASVNPVDILMVGGYGSAMLNVARRVSGVLVNGSEFPVTPGRDFSGHIVDTGCAVNREKYKVGDAVYGAGNVAYPGTHAQYVSVSVKELAHKPKTVSHIEAASLPYVATTSWAAICTISGYSKRNINNKRVLVVGGSGGVGTFVIQLLKAWGAHVTTTCSSDAINHVLQLGADIALDYTQHNVQEELKKLPGFDLIFDAVGGKTVEYAPSLLIPFSGATYVRVVVPFLGNVNQHGVAGGVTKSACQYSSEILKGLSKGVNIRWGLFMPSGDAMKTVAELVDEGKILPQVERVYPFNQLPAAYMKVAEKHNRGKTVIDVIGGANDSVSAKG